MSTETETAIEAAISTETLTETPQAIVEAVTTDPALEETPEQKHDGIQKRISEITKARRQAERERDYLADEKARLEREVNQYRQTSQAGKEPQLEDFDYDPSQYLKAMTDFKVNEVLSRREQEAQERAAESETQDMVQSFQQKEAQFIAQQPDYFQVAYAAPCSEVMGRAIAKYDNGPEILYALGQNPAYAYAIANLPAAQQVHAIAEVEAQLTGTRSVPQATVIPQQKPFSNAPPPVPTVSGSAPIEKDPEKMSADEWRTWRQKSLRNR